ncbi:MAG: hypothetical protein ACREYA_20565 [Cupriavidus necator]
MTDIDTLIQETAPQARRMDEVHAVADALSLLASIVMAAWNASINELRNSPPLSLRMPQ